MTSRTLRSAPFLGSAMALVLALPTTGHAGPRNRAPRARRATTTTTTTTSPPRRVLHKSGVVAKIPTVAIGATPTKNHGFLLGHGGAIDTDIAIDDFAHADHTVSLWVMLQYPHGDVGPLVTNAGSGTYFIGQANYHRGDYVPKTKAGAPVMLVQLGSTQAFYLVPEARDGRWVHVTVARRGGTFEMYIDGKRRTPHDSADVKVSASYSGKPHGKLRLGRRGKQQAYGFVDDVGIFDRALSPSEIATLAGTHRLSGDEPGLWKGLSFDLPEGGIPLPPKLDQTIETTANARRSGLSTTRQVVDRWLWTKPLLLAEMYPQSVQLPFAKGEVWKVVQGMNDPLTSHNGSAVFSIDFVRVGKPCTGNTVQANAPGKVLRYIDTLDVPDGSGGKMEDNKVHFQISSQLGFTYQHFEKDGLAPSITGGTWNPSNNTYEFAPGEEKHFAAGQVLGTIGNVACHVHMSAWAPGDAGKPQPYEGLEVSTDGGKTWQKHLRLVPRKGMWVRRTFDITFPKDASGRLNPSK